jgi:putative transcriptional regulator
MNVSRKSRRQRGNDYLDGQLLMAMPTMTDKRFQRAVIYICAHSAEGAMGLIINQQASKLTARGLFKQLGILKRSPDQALMPVIEQMPVHVGGPVETGRGFVLHSSDYFADEATLVIDKSVSLTATVDILKAIAQGKGPKRSILAMGYAGWAPGQLEGEIQANGWLNCAADLDLVFEPDLSAKYERALSKLGVDLSHLVGEAGHA